MGTEFSDELFAASSFRS